MTLGRMLYLIISFLAIVVILLPMLWFVIGVFRSLICAFGHGYS